MKRNSLMVLAFVHVVVSSALFFGLMANSLRDPRLPTTPWQDAGPLTMFWIVYFPPLVLQRMGIDFWVLSLLVILPNTMLWLAIVSLVAWVARRARRSGQQTG